MALFFDSVWFDARLAAAGLTRGDLASALGIGKAEIAEIWKDQRELSENDVRVLAGLLGVSRENVVKHAGISTPLPRDDAADEGDRLARIEAELSEIKSILLELKSSSR
jgi:transcriptional regulator with XRE-family HTH domain